MSEIILMQFETQTGIGLDAERPAPGAAYQCEGTWPTPRLGFRFLTLVESNMEAGDARGIYVPDHTDEDILDNRFRVTWQFPTLTSGVVVEGYFTAAFFRG